MDVYQAREIVVSLCPEIDVDDQNVQWVWVFKKATCIHYLFALFCCYFQLIHCIDMRTSTDDKGMLVD